MTVLYTTLKRVLWIHWCGGLAEP